MTNVLSVHPYFDRFSELMELLSANLTVDKAPRDKIMEITELMTQESCTDPRLKYLSGNVHFYERASFRVFDKQGNLDERLQFILSLYREKLSQLKLFVETTPPAMASSRR